MVSNYTEDLEEAERLLGTLWVCIGVNKIETHTLMGKVGEVLELHGEKNRKDPESLCWMEASGTKGVEAVGFLLWR